MRISDWSSDVCSSDLGLATELTRAVADEGYTEPTPIQAKAIPEILKGHDLLAAAQTGTGKTAAFTLPLLQRLHTSRNKPARNQVRARVLAPTLETAAPVQESLRPAGQTPTHHPTHTESDG